MAIQFSINGKSVSVDVDPQTPLLWVVRDELELTATKYGCGKGLCGACSLHIGKDIYRSCSLPVSFVAGKNVTTLEGLPKDMGDMSAIQRAWIDEQVPQCGYCQSGFMMATAKLLKDKPNPTDDDIKNNITNICRCGTHPRILKAIHRAALYMNDPKGKV
jgi:isoquinoline 1-oxidoreductase subunit alpha